MPVILEAIFISVGMLLIFALAFLAMFLLALAMFPIERELSKIVWESTAPKYKRTLPTPRKANFQDFSRKH
jgi:hypothetical protein